MIPILSFIIACLIILCYFGLKVYYIIEDRQSKKFKSNLNEFTSDCYALQQKWIRKGENSYSVALGLIIENFNKPEEEAPKTEYGKDFAKKMEAMFDEMNEDVEEMKDTRNTIR